MHRFVCGKTRIAMVLLLLVIALSAASPAVADTGGTVSYTAAGPAANAAGTVFYTYDDLGQIVEVHYPNGTVVTYTYDAAGNRTAYSVTVPGHKGDFDGNGCIELYDFVEFAAAFGSSTGDPNYGPIGDFDDNGEIGLYDFVEFAGVFGTCY